MFFFLELFYTIQPPRLLKLCMSYYSYLLLFSGNFVIILPQLANFIPISQPSPGIVSLFFFVYFLFFEDSWFGCFNSVFGPKQNTNPIMDLPRILDQTQPRIQLRCQLQRFGSSLKTRYRGFY